MKQDELATGSGYNSRSSIANIEQGSQMPPWDKAVAIADYLQLPLDAFRQADVVAARDKSFIIIEVKTARRLVNHLKKILDDLKKRIDAAQVS